MYDYQTLIAVPVSDTNRRPEAGQRVAVQLADGSAAMATYTLNDSPVMFEVSPPHAQWVDDFGKIFYPQPARWFQPAAAETAAAKWPDGCPLNEMPDYPHLRATIKRKVLKLCKNGRALDVRNIVRQFDGADRVSAVPDVDLPRLYEALGDYEAEAFKL